MDTITSRFNFLNEMEGSSPMLTPPDMDPVHFNQPGAEASMGTIRQPAS
jgi:hypothetical protein